MAIEKFTWPTERGETPDINYRVRTSKFGNGYAQNVGDGPNNKEDSYPVTCVGQKAVVVKIMEFLDRHAGLRRFSGRRLSANSDCSPAKSRSHTNGWRGLQTHRHVRAGIPTIRGNHAADQ